jgi:hypothetical protein
MALPQLVRDEHIRKAMAWIEENPNGIPRAQKIKKYEVRHGGRKYPPKFVIRKAHSYLNGQEFPNIFSGGTEANNFLINLGFKIWDRVNRRFVGLEAADEDPEKMFKEGKRLTQFKRHTWIERHASLPKHVKNRRLKSDPNLSCDVCGFSFVKTYGDIGLGFIEAHHLIPLGSIRGRRITKPSQIALVCSNCHRMLHQSDPLLKPKMLKDLVKAHKMK